MTSTFTDYPSAQLRLKSGCGGSSGGLIVDSAHCEATIQSFALSRGDSHYDAPTAAGNRQDGPRKTFRFTRDTCCSASHAISGRLEPLRV
jgi:hypothetical protein